MTSRDIVSSCPKSLATPCTSPFPPRFWIDMLISLSLGRRQMESHPTPHLLFAELMALLVRLAHHGLLHCDFNEFNIMILEDPAGYEEDDEAEAEAGGWRKGGEAVVIDFPQMVSVRHENAEL